MGLVVYVRAGLADGTMNIVLMLPKHSLEQNTLVLDA